MHALAMRIEATSIDWMPGRNVTVEVVSKKGKSGARRRSGKKQREERREMPRASFFRTCFRNLGPNEEIPEEELDEDEDEEDFMDCLLEDDYEQALALRDYLIPHAVRWYTGEACEDEEEGSSASGSDSDESSDDEQDDDDSDAPVPVARRGGGRGGHSKSCKAHSR